MFSLRQCKAYGRDVICLSYGLGSVVTSYLPKILSLLVREVLKIFNTVQAFILRTLHSLIRLFCKRFFAIM